jgi:hypothetical protein
MPLLLQDVVVVDKVVEVTVERTMTDPVQGVVVQT